MPDAAPNPVYQQTLQGLSALVSGTAAARLLDNSLDSAGLNAATVRPRQMRGLLLGPVLNELDRILPRGGLIRTLESLANELEILAPQPVAALSKAARTGHARPAASHGVRAREAQVVTGVSTALRDRQPGSRSRLEAAVLRLAAIDHVTLVAALRASGQTEFSRGTGDVAALARYGMLALSLLSRSGSLKTFFLTLEDSSLLLFPWGSDALLLTGQPQLNVGAVITQFNDIIQSKEES